MANKDLTVQLPVEDTTHSIEIVDFDKTEFASGDVVTIKKALQNKNNSLVLIADASSSGNLVIKAGNNYPNKILGDLTVALTAKVNAVLLEDISRFENKDGTVKFTGTFAGNVYAVAKRAGVKPVA